MDKIAKALVKAQSEFGSAVKGSANPFFKSKYADLATCVEAVMGALNNNGICLMQNCHESDTGVVVETIFLHESGESISNGRLHVPAAKNDPQGYGSALTYVRRYSLMAACGIAPEDDDGNAGSRPKETPKGNILADTTKEMKLLNDAAKRGTAALRKAWSGLTEEARETLKDQLASLKEAAAMIDEDIANQP